MEASGDDTTTGALLRLASKRQRGKPVIRLLGALPEIVRSAGASRLPGESRKASERFLHHV
jgi:hypothetical protein